jgi:hypothetical protein
MRQKRGVLDACFAAEKVLPAARTLVVIAAGAVYWLEKQRTEASSLLFLLPFNTVANSRTRIDVEKEE